MKIRTEQLEIRPLSSDQLSLYATGPVRLGNELRLTKPLEPLSEHMKKVFNLKASRIEAHPDDLLFHTYYLIIATHPRRLVGQLGLRGEPDDEGLVEVGYHIVEEEQCKGYMKEALLAFTHWLMKINQISGVNACTSKENIPSQRVLKASGYELVYQQGDLLVWRYTTL